MTLNKESKVHEVDELNRSRTLTKKEVKKLMENDEEIIWDFHKTIMWKQWR